VEAATIQQRNSNNEITKQGWTRCYCYSNLSICASWLFV